MMRRSLTLFFVFSFALMVVAFASPVLAGPLEDAKRLGHIGERYDGYLGVVHAQVPASAHSLVASINARRRGEYTAIASKNNLSVEQVGALAGQKLISRATAGEHVMLGPGAWSRR